MNASKGMDWLRLVFAQIDKAIYWLISISYSIIEKLAKTSIFNDGDIETFASRVYVFLGIIMLFKVTFSLITYLIDPDSANDKSKGTGNLIKNIIVTLFLIIIVPYGFDLLYSAQSAIINDNLIPRLILGTSDTEHTTLSVQMDEEVCGNGNVTKVSTYGEYLSVVSLRPFLQVYTKSDGSRPLISSLNETEKTYYCTGTISEKLSKTTVYADTLALNTGEYIFDYSFFVSTAFGILMFLLLLNFCFDIAVRTIKLGFLEIMAPIPIISYVDPKSGKDGIFKKWFKEVINTWISLFLRLVVIYFAVYIVKIINDNAAIIHDENGNIIMLFIMIGALMFAKQAVPLIENIFGIKFNHTVQLNPFKKISDQALGGKAVLGLGGAAAGAAIGATAFAGRTIANQIKNGAKNKRDMEKRKYDYSYRKLGDNPTEKNLERALKREEKYRNAENRYKAHEEKMEKKNDEKERRKEALNASSIFNIGKGIISGAVQAKDAAVEGSKEAQSMKFNPIDIGTKSSKSRDYKEMYNAIDRIKDTMTDFVGIKNDSGTTSAVKKAIEDQEKILERIARNIEIASKSFADLQTQMGPIEFNNAITWNSDGKMEIRSGYNGSYKNALEASINQLNQLEQAKLDAQKELKKQQNIKDKKGGTPPAK